VSEILHPDPALFRTWLKYAVPTFRLNADGQAITTGTTPTAITWASASADRWTGLSSPTWEIPGGAGAHYCFSAEGIQWDSNSTGDRYVSIERVTGGAATLGELLVPAAANVGSRLSVMSVIAPVRPGDTFQVTVYQDSGSTLNITNRARFMGYLVGGKGRN